VNGPSSRAGGAPSLPPRATRHRFPLTPSPPSPAHPLSSFPCPALSLSLSQLVINQPGKQKQLARQRVYRSVAETNFRIQRRDAAAPGVQLPGLTGARTGRPPASSSSAGAAAAPGAGGGGGPMAAGVAAGLPGLPLPPQLIRHAIAAALGPPPLRAPKPAAVPGVGGELAVAGAGDRGVPPGDARPRPGPPRVGVRALPPRHRRAPPPVHLVAAVFNPAPSRELLQHRAREAGEEEEEAAEPEPGAERQPRHRPAHQVLRARLHPRRQEEGLAQARRQKEAGDEQEGGNAETGRRVLHQERAQQPDQQHREQ
jgi:hypothetical protein